MFTHDLKFGLRMLSRKPLLTIGILMSLALGIGANSAVFSLVDAVLFKPLNVGNPSRLVSVYTSVKAAHGRTFQADEEQTSGTFVVSHSFWQTRLC